MTDDTTSIDRRTALKGLGGALATATLGGAAVLATSGPAAAATQDYGSATVKSDDGTVQFVAIYGDSRVEWSGFENAAESVSITVEAKIDGETNYQELYSTSADLTADSWGGAGEAHSGTGTSGWLESDVGLYHEGDEGEAGTHDPATDWAIVQASDHDDPYGIPTNEKALDASHLEVDTDGESAQYTITVRSTYEWQRADGSTEFSDTFTAPVDVTVENKPRDTTATDGGGESGATAE